MHNTSKAEQTSRWIFGDLKKSKSTFILKCVNLLVHLCSLFLLYLLCLLLHPEKDKNLRLWFISCNDDSFESVSLQNVGPKQIKIFLLLKITRQLPKTFSVDIHSPLRRNANIFSTFSLVPPSGHLNKKYQTIMKT